MGERDEGGEEEVTKSSSLYSSLPWDTEGEGRGLELLCHPSVKQGGRENLPEAHQRPGITVLPEGASRCEDQEDPVACHYLQLGAPLSEPEGHRVKSAMAQLWDDRGMASVRQRASHKACPRDEGPRRTSQA